MPPRSSPRPSGAAAFAAGTEARSRVEPAARHGVSARTTTARTTRINATAIYRAMLPRDFRSDGHALAFARNGYGLPS